MDFLVVLKRPAAWLPISMSLAAIGVIVVHIARFGTAAQTDEGTSAHLWQLLMGLQLPIIGYFAVRWLASSPKNVGFIIAMQVAAAVLACTPVYLLHW